MSQAQSEIVNNFKGLAIDAVPRPPRVTIEDVEEDDSNPSTSPNSKNDGINNVTVSPKKKSKFKLPINIRRSKKKEINCPSDTFTEEKNTSPASSPIFTQANRNVINIVNSKDIHWGPEIIYNIGTPTTDSPPSTDFTVKKTTSISTIMRSTEKVSHTYLDIISKNIGSGWRNICRSMGFSDGMIELQHENHIHAGLSEVIYQLFLDWVRNEDGSLGQLTTHLWTEGKRQLVKQLASCYQTELLDKKENSNLDEKK